MKSKGIQDIHRYMPAEERFWRRVNKGSEDQCWEWTGGTYNTGYGRMSFNGKYEHAQRVSWRINVGELSDELHVLHECDNRLCVNPKHLFLGTNLENIEDKVDKGRQSKGIERPAAKLTDELVRKIRKYRGEGFSYKQLSNIFGIAQGQLCMIVQRKAWKHVG